MPTPEGRIRDHLSFLYGPEGPAVAERLLQRLTAFRREHLALSEKRTPPAERLTERDVILITYGDQVQSPNRLPLEVLHTFLAERAKDLLSAVHILPFFPYSGDDGFSVIDYYQVDPRLGTWEEVRAVARDFRLMVDAVVNHVSRHSEWFRRYCAGDPAFAQAFIAVPDGVDLSQVVRPRALPLLTPVKTASGVKNIWTTFSADQMDVNAADPATLLRLLDVLLYYVAQGAEIIRLDAIAFLWKKIGTSCLHLEETHRVVKLIRAMLDLVAPDVMLITETNVPHRENISYFGDGSDEAQMVYQFPLPPLALYSLHRGNAAVMTRWAQDLSLPSEETTFYNFTASHDGIGVRPLEGILPQEEIQWLADRVVAHGGLVSYRTRPDGSLVPYELNCSYLDAVSNPQGGEPLDRQVQRFLVSQAMALALQGVPAVYFHSLFGSRNWHEGVRRTGRNRTINREKLDRASLERDVDDPSSVRAQVFNAYSHLIRVRKAEAAFHPQAGQKVVALDERLFALWRLPQKQEDGAVLCLHNVSADRFTLFLPLEGTPWAGVRAVRDLITGQVTPATAGTLPLTVEPYGVHWLKEVR